MGCRCFTVPVSHPSGKNVARDRRAPLARTLEAEVCMLEVQHLYRSYRGIPAVEDVSFRIGAGEVVGFLGPNGAGKSTTVKMITGMLRANDGKVLFEGHDIRDDMVGSRSVLGYVPEEAHL